MAVSGRKSDEKTVGEKILYTGLGEFKIIAVNPTQKELSKLGIELKSEPEYVSENEGVKRLRLDFWIQEVEKNFITKLSLWVNGERFKSKGGKYQYINQYGKCHWGKPDENGENPTEFPDFYLKENLRKTYRGEEDLHNFLAAYLNAKYDTANKEYDECVLETIPDMFKGNYKELKSIIKEYAENTVRLLCGVDENGYQVVYNKFFEKTCVNPNYVKWGKFLEEPYKQFKGDYSNNFNLKPYVGPSKVETASSEAEIDDFTVDVSEDDSDFL